MNLRIAPFAAALILAAVPAAPPVCAEELEPASLVTAADLESVMGGTWTLTADQPGSWVCEEADGFRLVYVQLVPVHPNDMTLAEELPAWREQGEVAEEIPDIGLPAMYQPEYHKATAEWKNAQTGERFRLMISVPNVDPVPTVDESAERRKFALELLRNAVARR